MRTFPNGESEASCIQRFLRNTGMPSLYSDTWLHGYHFIFLGSEASRITNRKYYDDAVLSDRQLHWLKRTLANANGDKPTFVFLHQPLPYTVAGSEAPFVVHADKLKSILNQYPQVILFTGHSHVTLRTRERNVVKQNFLMVNTASVRSPVWLSGVPTLGNEGIVVDVYPSRVVIWGREWKEGKWLYEYTQNEPSKWMVAPNMATAMKPVHQSISVLNQ